MSIYSNESIVFIDSEIKRYKEWINEVFEEYKNELKKYDLFLLSNMQSIWFENLDSDELDSDLDENNKLIIKEYDNDDLDFQTSSISFLFDGSNKNNEKVQFIIDKYRKIQQLIREEEIEVNEKIKYFCFFENSISDNQREDILYLVEKEIKEIKGKLEIIGINEIAQKWSNLNLENVDSFSFDIDQGQIQEYSRNNIDAFVLNLSAKSIKKVYQKYGKNSGPLYAENLRYHIKDKKVDDPIKKSIQEDYDNFWFKNNGIVIIAKKYSINEEKNKITISNFSVINGGQTTYMIGETDFENDFYVLSKILIPNQMIDEDSRKKFIEEIAISTNKQKPIKDKDLLSNDPIVSSLNKAFLNKKYIFDYKRGQKINSFYRTKNERHRIIKIDEIGQLYLAIFNQSPGSAKNEKAKIWKNDLRKKIFDENKVDFYINAHELWFKLDKVRKEKIKNIKKTEEDKYLLIYLNTSGWFIFTTIIMIYFIKKLKNQMTDIINNNTEYKKYLQNFQEDFNSLLSFELRINDSDIDLNIEQLMIEIAWDIKDIFEKEKDLNPSLNFSNWVKTNPNIFLILKEISRSYIRKDFHNEAKDKYLDAIFK